MPPAPSARPVPRRGKTAQLARNFLLFLCFWLVPLAWVWLTPPFSDAHDAEARTRQRLGALTKLLHAYVDRYKQAPESLAALRAFAVVKKRPFPTYDAYGHRFDYARLGGRHYIMRSFAGDGAQNTVGSPRDLGVVNWGPRITHGLKYQYTRSGAPHLFPAALLVGADSHDGHWLAKLYVDTGAGARRLVVRHRTQPGLFMVAHHDAVEEFYWLPSGKQIVFTASGSTRHRDGLFLWSLEDDTLINFSDYLEDAHGRIAPTSRGQGLWLSLGGVVRTEAGATVYAFRAPRHDGSLDPAEFFTSDRLIAVQVGEDRSDLKSVTPPATAGLVGQEPPLALGARLGGTAGLKAQKAWLALPLEGDMEKALLAWHRYSERETQGPLFPYCLWLLSSLYGESFAAMAERDPRDADVLRTFGTEIARALLNYTVAPTYIRALAIHSYESLMDGRPLPYRFSRLAATAGPFVAPAAAPSNH